MAILDDLKGILGDDQLAKISNNVALKARLEKGDELYGYYMGDDEPKPTPTPTPAAAAPAPAAPAPPASAALDLGAIERMFDTRLASLNKTIEDKIGDVVKTRGDELVNNAVKISIQRADELNRVYARHFEETGKAFDSAAFNEFLEKPETKARGFRSITEAYDAYASPGRTEREVERRVAEKLRENSGSAVPGTTPPPAVNSNIRHFIKRGGPADGAPATGAQRAAALLDARLAKQQAEAS